MSAEHDTTEASAEHAPAPVSAREQPASAELGTLPARVLSMQRSAGNQAVLRMLRREGLHPAPTPVPRRTLARRRIVTPAEIERILTDITAGTQVEADDFAAHQAGVERMFALASDELTDAQKATITANFFSGQTPASLLAMPRWQASVRGATSIVGAVPASLLGDPALIDTPPTTSTERANVRRLVVNANNVLRTIASGSRDADIRAVFGASKLAQAKRQYAAGQLWLNILFNRNRIVTDRSGYNAEVGLGGLTGFQAQISLEPGAIDDPNANDSVVTTIHESMHAGNGNVTDLGYIDRPEFPRLEEDAKINNAAHHEVVPWRILDHTNAHAFDGQTFVPAGSSGASGATAPLTPREQAVRGASEMIREAWTLGLNLHSQWVAVLRAPPQWDADLQGRFGSAMRGRTFASTMPYWSKVEKLTVHDRTHINSASTDPSTQPVTLIDVAISEGVTRKLSLAMGASPGTEAEAISLETNLASAPERAAATSVTSERDLLIRLTLRNGVGSITGNEDRDLQAILAMGTAGNQWTAILAVRGPGAFPY